MVYRCLSMFIDVYCVFVVVQEHELQTVFECSMNPAGDEDIFAG